MYNNCRNFRIFTVATAFILITWMLFNGCKAQVTFSRDWNPGKRGMDNSDYRAAMKSASTVCHLLVNQIRQLASCETTREDLDTGTSSIFSGIRQ